MNKSGRRIAGWVAAISLGAASATAQAPSQVTGPGAGVPPPPPGAGIVHGQVLTTGNPADVADLPVALYALPTGGTPGLAGTRTDAEGRFAFEGVSEAEGVVYLVGTEYHEVPFAQRAVFEAGATELTVTLELGEIVESAAGLETPETTYKFDWVGGQLFIQVSQRIINATDKVMYVSKDRRSQAAPLFAGALPAAVSEYIDGQGGRRTDLVRQGQDLAFWGPVYPGPQDVRYGYLLDGPGFGDQTIADEFEVVDTLPAGTGQLRALVPRGAGAPIGAGLEDTLEPVMIEETEYASYLGPAIAPGGEIRIVLPVQATSTDPDSLHIARADFWIDHDDTAIRVTAEVHLEVSGSTRLAAPRGSNLLDLELPPDAEFLGLNGSSEMLGVKANGSGGLAVRGPLSPGTSVVAYRYRLPVDGRAELDLRFERPVDLLNVLVADTGVVIESDRLHRKRPFKQGTRFYLHREAYQLGAGESVVVGLGPLERPALSPVAAQGAALGLAALAAFFLFTPLRSQGASSEPTDHSEWAAEREVLYESIRDLDHDFETGKVEEADYQVMRGELRNHAIDLMREEKQRSSSEALPARENARACPSCGAIAPENWKFCAECGSDLETGKEPA